MKKPFSLKNVEAGLNYFNLHSTSITQAIEELDKSFSSFRWKHDNISVSEWQSLQVIRPESEWKEAVCRHLISGINLALRHRDIVDYDLVRVFHYYRDALVTLKETLPSVLKAGLLPLDESMREFWKVLSDVLEGKNWNDDLANGMRLALGNRLDTNDILQAYLNLDDFTLPEGPLDVLGELFEKAVDDVRFTENWDNRYRLCKTSVPNFNAFSYLFIEKLKSRSDKIKKEYSDRFDDLLKKGADNFYWAFCTYQLCDKLSVKKMTDRETQSLLKFMTDFEDKWTIDDYFIVLHLNHHETATADVTASFKETPLYGWLTLKGAPVSKHMEIEQLWELLPIAVDKGPFLTSLGYQGIDWINALHSASTQHNPSAVTLPSDLHNSTFDS